MIDILRPLFLPNMLRSFISAGENLRGLSCRSPASIVRKRSGDRRSGYKGDQLFTLFRVLSWACSESCSLVTVSSSRTTVAFSFSRLYPDLLFFSTSFKRSWTNTTSRASTSNPARIKNRSSEERGDDDDVPLAVTDNCSSRTRLPSGPEGDNSRRQPAQVKRTVLRHLFPTSLSPERLYCR